MKVLGIVDEVKGSLNGMKWADREFIHDRQIYIVDMGAGKSFNKIHWNTFFMNHWNHLKKSQAPVTDVII